MQTGDRVEVKTRYQGSWSAGFTVAAVSDLHHREFLVRRDSDGAVLPALFSDDDLRAAPGSSDAHITELSG
jgi:hypothetical protein